MGSVGVVHAPAEVELHALGGQLVSDRTGVGHGPGKPVELGRDQGVSRADCGQGLA